MPLILVLVMPFSLLQHGSTGFASNSRVSGRTTGHPRGTLELPADLKSLTRRELQTLAKQAGLRANQKSEVLIASLQGDPAPLASASLPAQDVALPEDLAALTRRDLQALAKQLGVRANQKSLQIIADLEALRALGGGRAGTSARTDSDDRDGEGAGSGDGERDSRGSAESTDKSDSDQGGGDDRDAREADDALLPDFNIALILVQRPMPAMLAPAECTGGRWRPLRLVGDSGVEATFVIRDEHAGSLRTADVLDVPPVKHSGSKLGELRLQPQPAVELSAAEVEACVQWTATVMGVLGVDDDAGLLPRAVFTLPGDVPTSAARDATRGDEAALLLRPSEADLRTLELLRDPEQWADADIAAASASRASGATGSNEEAADGQAEWQPHDASGAPLAVVMSAHKRRQFMHAGLRAGASVPRGLEGMAVFDPDENSQVHDNPKTKLQALAQRERGELPVYEAEAVGEQLWVATVRVGDCGPYRGAAASRKRDAEKNAASVAIEALGAMEALGAPTELEAAAGASGSEASEPLRGKRGGAALAEASAVGAAPVRAAASAEASAEASTETSAEAPSRSSMPLHALDRCTFRLGGYVLYHVEQLDHQLYVATATLEGMQETEHGTMSPALRDAVRDTMRDGGATKVEVSGDRARSKKLAHLSAARAALDAWFPGYESDEEERAGDDGARAAESLSEGDGGGAPAPAMVGEQRLIVPLRASQWRGASCAVLAARVLAHADAADALRADLAELLRPAAVPTAAQLRSATTPKAIGGYKYSNEHVRWVGNAVLGLCCKVAAVMALGESPRVARKIRHWKYDHWTSSTFIASKVHAHGWAEALLLKEWPGDSGVTRGAASAETIKDMFEAVVGAVFLRSVAAHGIDGAMEDAWRVSSTVVANPYDVHARERGDRLHREGRRPRAPPGWHEALDTLRSRLLADRPGHVKVWVDRLAIDWPSEPRLIVAATYRAYEGQSLEFIGDGVLRIMCTLHLMRTLPEADRLQKSRARIAMERNPFLARRIARVIGNDSRGLSAKLWGAQQPTLASIARVPPSRTDVGAFKADLVASDGEKILADLLEGLIGAVALLEEAGLEGAHRSFGPLVLPPPPVIVALANREVAVPGAL